MTTYFDRLPVELIYMIFKYMSNNDILWSFFNLSPYLNNLLHDYNWSKLNFQSISKSRFDFICNSLNVEKLHSLTLSNNFQTPGQVQLFFQRFHLRDFLNLHTLSLLSIINEDIYPILSDLPKLKYLKSLFTKCRSSQPLLLGQILNQLKTLENLSISHGDIFDHNVLFPLYHLKTLDCGKCNFLELRRLQIIVPSLISLKINLQANHQLQLLEDTNIWTDLKRLNLTLNDPTTTVTFIELQQFLDHFKNLIDLTLNIRGSSDNLADGNRWQTYSRINYLEKFHFIIEFTDVPINLHRRINQVLKSFSTSFWQDIKKWYVAITTYYLYTISCFNDELFSSTISPPLSTSPNNSWYYLKIQTFKIEKYISLNNLHHFSNLKRLIFFDEINFLSIDNIKQFYQLHHLIFSQPISNTILNNILQHNPHINHLTLSQNNFNQLKTFKTIHYLHIQDTIQFSQQLQIKDLSRIFPSIKQLFLHLNSIRLIIDLINHFHCLENGIFNFNQLSKPISYEWIKENTRLNNINISSFTCRSESNRFLIWISNCILNQFVHFKDKTSDLMNSIQIQSSKKCLLQ